MGPPGKKIGILIAQLGTPDAPQPGALRRFLREFLWDPRVIELNRVKWWLILNLFVLTTRPRKSAAAYRKVWTEAGSPLLRITLAQAEKLEQVLGNDRIRVRAGMRYGKPSLRAAIDDLCGWGAERILLFPMYPQYSGPTTASSCDSAFAGLLERRYVPALRVVPPYHDHPAYIEAVAAVARERLAAMPWKPDLVLMSFHGVPRRTIEKGDPYRGHVELTATKVAAALGLEQSDWMLAFQSRFGKEPWLEPYTDETLKKLGGRGVRRIAALCPGFIADCLETLDEIAILGAEQFRSGGGEELRYIPCVNDHPAWIEAMKKIALQELSGWL
jgi:ferrochelatase